MKIDNVVNILWHFLLTLKILYRTTTFKSFVYLMCFPLVFLINLFISLHIYVCICLDMSSYIWAWQPFFLRSKYNLLSLHFYTEKDNITFVYLKGYLENSLRVIAVFIFHPHWGGTSCAATTLAERGCKINQVITNNYSINNLFHR